MNTLQLFGAFALALLVALVIIPFIIDWARSLGLLDQPDHRKIHTEKVSNLGGIGIFTAWMIAMGCFLLPLSPGLMAGVMLVVPLFVLAIIDDVNKVGVTTRLVFQALTGVIAYELGFKLEVVENMWLLNQIATVLLFMTVINAFNLIDGINGLAGSLGLVGSLAFAYYFINHGQMAPGLAALAYGGALSGFLYYNFRRRARIFMGDNGSVVMGYFMALMMILVIEHPAGDTQQTLPLVQFGLSTIFLPTVDMGRVFFFRLMRRRSPFYGDRTHLHHYFVDNGFSHPVASTLLAGVHTTIVFAGTFLSFGWWLTVSAVSTGAIYMLAAVVSASQRTAISTPAKPFEGFRVPA